MGFLKFFAASAFKLSVLFASVLLWYFVIRNVWIGGFSYVGMPRIGDITQTWPLLLSSWFLGWKRKESQFVTFVTAFFVAGYAGWQLWPDILWSQDILKNYSLQDWILNAPIINIAVYALTILAAVLTVILTSENALNRVLGWRNGGFKKMKISKSTVFGKSRLMTEKELRAITKEAESCYDVLVFGQFSTTSKLKIDAPAELFLWPLEAHHITIAPTRAGKGISLIVPNVLYYGGPIVIIDPKGESLMICGRHRTKTRKVVAIDPYEICDVFESDYKPDIASYNVLDFVGKRNEISDIKMLIDALFTPLPGGKPDDHWRKTAKIYISGLIHYAHFMRAAFPERGTLNYVYDLLTLSDEDEQRCHWEAMVKHGGLAKDGGALLLKAATEERQSILSTSQSTLSWLAIPELARVVETSTFSLDELNDNTADLFVCIPAERLEQAKEVMRIFTSLPINNAMRKPVKRRILAIIDEAPLVGKLEAVVNAFRFAAGKGVSVWLFSQTKADLEAAYGKEETVALFGNVEMLSVFGLGKTNTEMSKWISEAAGSMTIEQTSINKSSGNSSKFTDVLAQKSDNTGKNIQEAERKLFTIDDIGNLGATEILLLPRSKHMQQAAKIDRVAYFESNVVDFHPFDSEKGKRVPIYDRNPLFTEKKKKAS